jgi:two-component system, sporulation sensor kinase E
MVMLTAPNKRTEELKKIISDSHKRVASNGMKPDEIPVGVLGLTRDQLSARLALYSDFISIANLFGTKVIDLLSETGIVIIITDKDNNVLEHFGDETIRQGLKALNILPGYCLDEEYAGTNASYLANKHKVSVSLVGTDHYHTFLSQSACYCVPFDFGGTIEGTIAIMTSVEGHSNYRSALIENMVNSMQCEYQLRKNYRRELLVNSIFTGNTDNGVIIVSEKGFITEYNSVSQKLIGVSSCSVLGKNYADLTVLASIIEESLSTLESKSNLDVVFEHKDGKIVKCLIDIIHIMDNGFYKGTYLRLKDMTEKYALEQQIIIQDRFSAIGKLAAGLAHEIRNPLTSVMGFMQLLTSAKDYSKLDGYLPIMYEELTRVKNLVSDFVTMSKPSCPLKTSFEISSFLTNLTAMMESQATLNGVELLSDYSLVDGESLIADSSQLKQVIINTIQNAIESCEEKNGTVTIGCSVNKEDKTCIISVTDTGCGMDEATLKQIMTPFYTTKDTGTGLGMAVSYRIMENHGGSIQVSSTLGVGSRVNITLPY